MCLYIKTIVLFCLAFQTSTALRQQLYPENEGKTSYWYSEAQKNLRENLERKLQLKPARNVILFLGDGMGVTGNTAGRIYRGQKENLNSEQTNLAWETFPHTGLVKTYDLDYHTTDSASSATAFLCGTKAPMETLGVGPEVIFNQCKDVDKNSVDSIAAWAIREGKWAGIVTTTRVTHATPAGTYAHTPSRYWENNAKGSFINYVIQNGVILGGGRREFLPNTTEDYEINYGDPLKKNYGKRTDGMNLIEKWQQGQCRRKFVYNLDQLNAVDLDETDYLLGLFEHNHLEYQLLYDLTNRMDNPTLEQMTKTAIKMLSKSPKGFFLLVESGRIDQAFHKVVAAQGLEEIRMFHKTVATADQMTSAEETLMVVTADHSHVINLVGYPKRNVSILGTFIDPDEGGRKIEPNLDNLPSTLLVFANGPSAKHGRQNLTGIDTEDPHFQQPALIPLEWESHGGEDVGIYARGPYSHLFTGTIENSYIPHAMAYALCIGPSKDTCFTHPHEPEKRD